MNRFLDPIILAWLTGAPAVADRDVKLEKAKESSGKQPNRLRTRTSARCRE